MASTDRLRMAREAPLIGYSTGNFGKNLLLSGIDVTLLFMLTDLVGITPAAVGLLMIVVFFGDLVFDIGAGFIASHARAHGFGYRRIIAIGVVPCGLAFALLYSLPTLGLRAFWVLAATMLTFRAAYAIIDVPHNSLLARVAPDSRARGRTSGYRLFFSSLASLAIATVLTPAVIDAARHGQTARLSVLGLAGAGLFCLALWFAAWSAKSEQGARPDGGRRSRVVLLPRLDPLFAAIAVVAFVTGFAIPLFGRMVIYLSTYVYGDAAMAGHVLLAITAGQFPGVILWTWLVRYGEKTTLLASSYALAAIGITLFAVVGGERGPVAVAALIGVGFAGIYMLPWGILADIIDFAEFRHGDRREAPTFAAILVVIKASGAASVATIGWTLAQLGYVAGASQRPGVLTGIKLIAFGVPLAGCAVAILVLSRMSIGHAVHARVIRALSVRRQSR